MALYSKNNDRLPCYPGKILARCSLGSIQTFRKHKIQMGIFPTLMAPARHFSQNTIRRRTSPGRVNRHVTSAWIAKGRTSALHESLLFLAAVQMDRYVGPILVCSSSMQGISSSMRKTESPEPADLTSRGKNPINRTVWHTKICSLPF